MKITVFGLGAMGSIYAALLADDGNEVWAVDPWKEQIEAIQRNGLKVDGASGDRTVSSINVAENTEDLLEDLKDTELFIVATKAGGVESAAKTIQPLINSSNHVLTIQNGLGSGERIAEFIPEKNILLGVAEGFGASVKEPGYIQHTAMKMIRIGSYKKGNENIVEDITKMWQRAGFNANSYSDITQLIWEKFICNVAYSAPCTVFEKSVIELIKDPSGQKVSQNCALEAWRVACEKGINLCFEDPIDYITEFAERVGDSRHSMYLDHLAHRPSEIDAINGMVPVVANSVGLEAQYNEVLTHILRSREAAWK